MHVRGARGIIRVAWAQAYGVAKFVVDSARFGVGGLPTLVVAATYALVLVALVIAVRHAIS